MKRKLLAIGIILIFLLVGLSGCTDNSKNNNTTNNNSSEFVDFQNMARNATCSDKTNKLYVINDQIVFWIVEGNCPDASYSYTLFGNTSDMILCKKFDSIAGPQEQFYDESYKEIFQIMINNINSDDLGLDNNYKIIEIQIT